MPFGAGYKYPWETPAQARARTKGETTTVTPGTTTVEETWSPVGQAPTRPTIPTLETPAFDEREVSKIAAREAAPSIRRLRDVTARAIGQNLENPNVRRMTVREALQGFGSGLGSILSGAQRAAVQQYMPRYEASVSAAQTQFGANVESLAQEYNNLWNQFLRSGTTKRVTTSTT